MSRRGASAETKFLRGETGVDGAAVKEDVDPTQLEQEKAKEALYRGRTWLGREALTWWLYKSESTEPFCALEKKSVTVAFIGKLTLKAAGGDVTEVQVKGVTAPYSSLVRRALRQGLLVHAARLKLTWNEQVYEVSVDAEHFDVRAGKLPELVQDSEEALTERLELVGRLGQLLDTLMGAFSAVRVGSKWTAEVKAMQAWLESKGQER